MKKLWNVLACASVVQLSACGFGAQPVADGQEAGAVPAHVEELLGELAAGLPCLDQLSQAENQPLHLIRVEFRRNRLRSSVLAVVPADIVLQHGDEVLLRSFACTQGSGYYVVKILQSAVAH